MPSLTRSACHSLTMHRNSGPCGHDHLKRDEHPNEEVSLIKSNTCNPQERTVDAQVSKASPSKHSRADVLKHQATGVRLRFRRLLFQKVNETTEGRATDHSSLPLGTREKLIIFVRSEKQKKYWDAFPYTECATDNTEPPLCTRTLTRNKCAPREHNDS